jgi:hypothetical protein
LLVKVLSPLEFHCSREGEDNFPRATLEVTTRIKRSWSINESEKIRQRRAKNRHSEIPVVGGGWLKRGLCAERKRRQWLVDDRGNDGRAKIAVRKQ